MSGTVNIARSIFDHELFADQPLTKREAWIWLIMEASWKPRKKRVGDYIVDLERGQLAASVRFMAGAWKWTPAKVQRFIKRLQVLEMISVKTDTGVSVVSICNYEEYQGQAKAADTGPIQVRYRSDTNEKKGEIREEEKEEGKPSSKKKRGSRLSPDWFLPKEWGEWAVNEGCSVEGIRTEAARFKDYWHSKAGPTASKLDWQATWRNWIRDAMDRNPKIKAGQYENRNSIAQFPTNGRGNGPDPALEQIARLTGLSATSGDGGFRTGSLGEENGPLWMGTRPQ